MSFLVKTVEIRLGQTANKNERILANLGETEQTGPKKTVILRQKKHGKMGQKTGKTGQKMGQKTSEQNQTLAKQGKTKSFAEFWFGIAQPW